MGKVALAGRFWLRLNGPPSPPLGGSLADLAPPAAEISPNFPLWGIEGAIQPTDKTHVLFFGPVPCAVEKSSDFKTIFSVYPNFDEIAMPRTIQNMAILKVGQNAPDVDLRTINDEPVSLSSLWGDGRPTLLIFLRHLA